MVRTRPAESVRTEQWGQAGKTCSESVSQRYVHSGQELLTIGMCSVLRIMVTLTSYRTPSPFAQARFESPLPGPQYLTPTVEEPRVVEDASGCNALD